jgi:hypothetical protein
MVDAGASKLTEFSVFRLPFHPMFEIRSVLFLVGTFGIDQIFSFGRNNHFG